VGAASSAKVTKRSKTVMGKRSLLPCWERLRNAAILQDVKIPSLSRDLLHLLHL